MRKALYVITLLGLISTVSLAAGLETAGQYVC